jgi:hypothetical protein
MSYARLIEVLAALEPERRYFRTTMWADELFAYEEHYQTLWSVAFPTLRGSAHTHLDTALRSARGQRRLRELGLTRDEALALYVYENSFEGLKYWDGDEYVNRSRDRYRGVLRWLKASEKIARTQARSIERRSREQKRKARRNTSP